MGKNILFKSLFTILTSTPHLKFSGVETDTCSEMQLRKREIIRFKLRYFYCEEKYLKCVFFSCACTFNLLSTTAHKHTLFSSQSSLLHIVHFYITVFPPASRWPSGLHTRRFRTTCHSRASRSSSCYSHCGLGTSFTKTLLCLNCFLTAVFVVVHCPTKPSVWTRFSVGTAHGAPAVLFRTGKNDGSDGDVRGGGGARAAGPPVPALGRRAPRWASPAPAPSQPRPP